MKKKRRNRKKPKTLQQVREYLNDQSIRIKQVSREVFMEADIGTRRHKVKNKYTRKPKYKNKWQDEIQEGE